MNKMMTTTKIATPLSRKAVLLAVNVSTWSARKLDKKVTRETNANYNATDDAGRYNKRVISATYLEDIGSLVTKVRHLHYAMTQPWADDGPRILPNMLFNKFSLQFRELKKQFNEAADKFAAAYPTAVAERRADLKGMFNEADYPPASEIRSKFNLDLIVLPFPDANDFRSDLDADTVADIKRELADTSERVVNDAMKHTADKIVKVVGHMATRLAEYKAEPGQRLYQSLVDNVRELADVLPAFNLTDDPKFAALTKRIDQELCVEDADSLKENEAVRADVQRSADEIVAAVADLFA